MVLSGEESSSTMMRTTQKREDKGEKVKKIGFIGFWKNLRMVSEGRKKSSRVIVACSCFKMEVIGNLMRNLEG